MPGDAEDGNTDKAEGLVRQVLDYKKERERNVQHVKGFENPNNAATFASALEHVLESHSSLSATHYSSFLNACAQKGPAKLAAAALDWWNLRHDALLSKDAYDSVIVRCSREFDCENTLIAYQQLKTSNHKSDVAIVNLVIAACAHCGRVNDAFSVVQDMLVSDLTPNTFTIAHLLLACNFKRKGVYENAINAYNQWKSKTGKEPPEILTKMVLDVCEAALDKSANMGEAYKVLGLLSTIGLSRNIIMYNALLRACARQRDWLRAHDVFLLLEANKVKANTGTYNALIAACTNSGQVEKALEVLEWMAAGRAAEGPVGADLSTYNMLIKACHRAGMLEKALEVMSWLEGSGLEFNQETYESLINTVEIAQLWDVKASAKAFRSRGAVTVNQLRPAPFDGMRMLYLEHSRDNIEESILAKQKIGCHNWAPSGMRSLPTAPIPPRVLPQMLSTFRPSGK